MKPQADHVLAGLGLCVGSRIVDAEGVFQMPAAVAPNAPRMAEATAIITLRMFCQVLFFMINDYKELRVKNEEAMKLRMKRYDLLWARAFCA